MDSSMSLTVQQSSTRKRFFKTASVLILTVALVGFFYSFVQLSIPTGLSMPAISFATSAKATDKDFSEERSRLEYVHTEMTTTQGMLEIINEWDRKTSELVKTVTQTESFDKITESPLLNRKKYTNEKCQKRLPQAIIAGIQKCGTSALLWFLNFHPQIAACMSPKETQFFSHFYNKGLNWYRNLMPCSYSHQVTIEKSPPYFYRGNTSHLIKQMDPATKIIFTVKDPIVRIQSAYAMKQSKIKHMAAIENALTNPEYGVIPGFQNIIQFSKYTKYIQPWIDDFSFKQILFVDGQNLEINPAEELHKVERFLNIDTYFTEDRFWFNKTKGKYCFKSEKNELNCLGENKGRVHPVLSESLREKLVKFYRPYNMDFFKKINRTFDWGY